MKINNFRGDLTDISAKEEALISGTTVCKGIPQATSICKVGSPEGIELVQEAIWTEVNGQA